MTDEQCTFIPVQLAVLSVFDTRTLETDSSGATLAGRIEAAGHMLADRKIVKDDVIAIAAAVRDWIDDGAIDVIITTGGTGFAARDVTPEAVRPLLQKEMEGFAVVFTRSAINRSACPRFSPGPLRALPTAPSCSACPAPLGRQRMHGTR